MQDTGTWLPPRHRKRNLITSCSWTVSKGRNTLAEHSPPSSQLYEPSGLASALVVSGFLGAGKTTLVRHLLQTAQKNGVRLAVISNEFGALGIDQVLLDGAGASGYVELEGGCVCCKLSDELVQTLQRLWETVHPNRVIVETSGVALPFETLLNFWREPVSHWISDCVAVVVVNAEQLYEGRNVAGTFEQQVSSADLLILNKLDLVPPSALNFLERRLREMAPDAPVLRAVQASIDPQVLFPPEPHGYRDRSRALSRQSHTHELFEAEELIVEEPVEPPVLVERIRALNPIRAKGFVSTPQGVRLVQGVGTRIDLVESPIAPPIQLLGRVVLIRQRDPVKGDDPDKLLP
ncbi:MAG: GTP-binding protein [Nitrospirae bacterium]|nr:MAG: GTP-binding protein [Nitrospirota bacterium]